jgi:hypothetical protein
MPGVIHERARCRRVVLAMVVQRLESSPSTMQRSRLGACNRESSSLFALLDGVLAARETAGALRADASRSARTRRAPRRNVA